MGVVTDNTKTLINALERIKELEDELAFTERCEGEHIDRADKAEQRVRELEDELSDWKGHGL